VQQVAARKCMAWLLYINMFYCYFIKKKQFSIYVAFREEEF